MMHINDENFTHVHYSTSKFTLGACSHQVNTVILCFDLIHYYSDIIHDVKHGKGIMLVHE